MPRQTLTAKSSSARLRSARRFLLVLAAALIAAVLAGGLDAELEELDASRNRIEERWEDLDREMQVRARLATELAGLDGPARPGVSEEALAAARKSLSGSVRMFEGAEGREAGVETSLSVDQALGRLHGLLGVEAGGDGGDGRSALTGPPEAGSARRALEEIEAAEHRVAIRRTAYNEAIQQFNTRLALFPANLAARLFGFERYPYYLPTDIRDTIEMAAPAVGNSEKVVRSAEKAGDRR